MHRRLRHVWALGCSFALFLCASCSTPQLTELVVVVELGDGLEVPRDMTHATIRVERIAGQLVRESVPFTGPDARDFPLTLGLRQAEDLVNSCSKVLTTLYPISNTASISSTSWDRYSIVLFTS